MKRLLSIHCRTFLLFAVFISHQALSQVKDSLARPPALQNQVKIPINSAAKPNKPEIFTNGFIDIINNGQINASARFIRLYIGEPGRFAIPLSLYSGVSANNFQNQISL